MPLGSTRHAVDAAADAPGRDPHQQAASGVLPTRAGQGPAAVALEGERGLGGVLGLIFNMLENYLLSPKRIRSVFHRV